MVYTWLLKDSKFLYLTFRFFSKIAMNTASILLPLNTRMGSLHLKALSDQSLMELFVENVDDYHKAQFQNSDGTYKDICKWIGIKCDKKRRVTQIHWEQEFPGMQWSGHLDFALLPQHLQAFTFNRDPGRAFRDGRIDIRTAMNPGELTGTIETSTLPLDLRVFEIKRQSLSSTVDFRRIPSRMTIFCIKSNKFYGRALLTALPQSIEALDFSENKFLGSLCLEFLPKTLNLLDASSNRLSGSLVFDNLPAAMITLDLSSNAFTGSLYLARPPPRLNYLSIMSNLLSGTAVVAYEAKEKILIKGNEFSSISDENGVLYPIEEWE